jgi:PAS domain S-box-containing protein
MVLSDGGGIVLMANAAYCTLYGYEPEEMIGHSFAIIFSPERRAEALDQYRAVFTGGQDPPTYETSILRRDGSEHFVQAPGHGDRAR